MSDNVLYTEGECAAEVVGSASVASQLDFGSTEAGTWDQSAALWTIAGYLARITASLESEK